MQDTLGNILRSARESSGITVDDAVYRAKMPRDVVIALEQDDFGFFTSPLYARSFLKQYGSYVGADVEPWLDDLVAAPLIDGENLDSFIDLSKPRLSSIRSKKEVIRNSGASFAPLWLLLITGALVWGGFKFFSRLDGKLSTTPLSLDPDQINIGGNPPPIIDPEVRPPIARDTPLAESETNISPEPTTVATTEPEPPRRAIVVDVPTD